LAPVIEAWAGYVLGGVGRGERRLCVERLCGSRSSGTGQPENQSDAIDAFCILAEPMGRARPLTGLEAFYSRLDPRLDLLVERARLAP
jgi:hypothetical protein